MPAQLIQCPRCGESLPAGLQRCDSCGAFLVPTTTPSGRAASHGPAPRSAASRIGRSGGGTPSSKGKRPRGSRDVPAVAYLLLVAGLVVGGLIGYTLRASIGPRDESGAAPAGPADLMTGGMGGTGAAGGGGMPPEVMQRLQEYRAVLARDPGDLQANMGLGNLYFDSSQWSKAIDHYAKALERDPKNADVRVDRAIAYHNLGQDQQAVTEMGRVTKESPTHKNAWLNLGVVSAGMGDRETAVRAWERYLALEPSGERSDGIREELARLKQP